MATISDLGSDIQNQSNSEDRHLGGEFSDTCRSQVTVCVFGFSFASWSWVKPPGFHSEVISLVAVWADQFKVLFGRITRVVVVVMDLKNLRYFIIATSVAFIAELLSGVPALPDECTVRSRFFFAFPADRCPVALLGAELLVWILVLPFSEFFVTYWAGPRDHSWRSSPLRDLHPGLSKTSGAKAGCRAVVWLIDAITTKLSKKRLTASIADVGDFFWHGWRIA